MDISSVSFPQFDNNIEDKTDSEFKTAKKKANKKILGIHVVKEKDRKKIDDGHQDTMPKLKDGRSETDRGKDSFEKAKPMAQAGQQEMSRSLTTVSAGSFSARGTNGNYTMPSIGMNANINISSGMGVDAMFSAFSQTQTSQMSLFNAMGLINNDAMKQSQLNGNLMKGANFYGNLEAKYGNKAQGHFMKSQNFMKLGQSLGNVGQVIGKAAQMLDKISTVLESLASALNAIPFVGPAISAALKVAAKVIKMIGKGLTMVAQSIVKVAQKFAQLGTNHMQQGAQARAQAQMAGMQKQMLQMQLKQGMQTLQQIGNARDNIVNLLGQNMKQQAQLMQMLQGYGYMQGQSIPNAGMFGQGGMFGANNLMGMMGMMGMMSPLMNMMGGMMAQSMGMGMGMPRMQGQGTQGFSAGFGMSVAASISPGQAIAPMGGFSGSSGGGSFGGGFQGGQSFAQNQRPAISAMPNAITAQPMQHMPHHQHHQPHAQHQHHQHPQANNRQADPRQMQQQGQLPPGVGANQFGMQNQMGQNGMPINSANANSRANGAGGGAGSGKKAQYEKQLIQLANNILSKNSGRNANRTGGKEDPTKAQLRKIWMQANKEKVVIDKEVANLVNRALGENQNDKNANNLNNRIGFTNGRQPFNQAQMRGNQFAHPMQANNQFMPQNQHIQQTPPQQLQQQPQPQQAPVQTQPQIQNTAPTPQMAAPIQNPSVSPRG